MTDSAFVIPVISDVYWVARCQYMGHTGDVAAMFDVAGLLVCRSCDDVRFVPNSRSLDEENADVHFDDSFVGPGPWLELRPYENNSIIMDRPGLELWRFDAEFIGMCYLVHNAVRVVQTRFRTRLRLRKAAFKEAVLDKAFPGDIVDRILSLVC